MKGSSFIVTLLLVSVLLIGPSWSKPVLPVDDDSGSTSTSTSSSVISSDISNEDVNNNFGPKYSTGQGPLLDASSLQSSSSSANRNYFRNLLYSSSDINRTLLYHKSQVTPELIELLRNNPDLAASTNNNTIHT